MRSGAVRAGPAETQDPAPQEGTSAGDRAEPEEGVVGKTWLSAPEVPTPSPGRPPAPFILTSSSAAVGLSFRIGARRDQLTSATLRPRGVGGA